MASREELLQSIQPGMRLTKAFFLRVYGYEITWPGFADRAIGELEWVGCLKARQYYEAVVNEYEDKQREGLQEVSRWYAGELEREWKYKEKEGEQGRKQEEITLLKRKQELLQRKRMLLMSDFPNFKE